MRKLGLLLCLGLIARAGDDPATPVVRIHDVADLKTDEAWWAVAVARVKTAAAGAQVRPEQNNLIVVAAPAVHERVARELTEVREAFGQLVQLEVRLLTIEGGLGVASVPVEKLDAFLKEKKAESLAAPMLVCRNGQQASLSVLRHISYVSDFEIALDGQGGVTADPVVDTVSDGITAKLRPFVAGQVVRVAADVSVSEVDAQIAEVELALPLPTPVKIQVPESTTRSVRKLLECGPAAFCVVDLGGGQVVLIRATPLRAEEIGGFGGEEPEPDEK